MAKTSLESIPKLQDQGARRKAYSSYVDDEATQRLEFWGRLLVSFIVLFPILLFAKVQKFYCSTYNVMGTPFKICVWADESDAEKVKKDIGHSLAVLDDIDRWMSEWKPTSELTKVNNNAGIAPVEVSERLFQTVRYALKISQDSNGAFDPTFNALWGTYNFKKGSERSATKKELSEKLPLINYKNVILAEKEKSIYLAKKGMKLGLGGIGQGYAVDEIVKILKYRGYNSGYVDGSGDTFFWGKKPNGSLWTTGIRDPFDHKKRIAKIYGTDFAITTCGDDEKFFIKDGKRIHHIIDPKSGLPSYASRQATVIASTAMEADAWDTASFVLGPKEAKELTEKRGLQGVFVGPNGKVTMTSGLKITKTKWGEVFILNENSTLKR